LFTSRAIRAIGVSRIVPRDRAIDLSAGVVLRSFIFFPSVPLPRIESAI
jgi:hypothetical protein